MTASANKYINPQKLDKIIISILKIERFLLYNILCLSTRYLLGIYPKKIKAQNGMFREKNLKK